MGHTKFWRALMVVTAWKHKCFRKKNAEALSNDRKKVGLGVNAVKTKYEYVFLWCEQNAV